MRQSVPAMIAKIAAGAVVLIGSFPLLAQESTIEFIVGVAIAAGLAVSLLTTACGSSEKTSYTIHGEIAGIPDSSVVLLSSLTHTSPDTIAEAVVTDGKFEITGVAEEPRAVTLYIKDNYGSKVFMLENADISINGVVKSMKFPTVNFVSILTRSLCQVLR